MAVKWEADLSLCILAGMCDMKDNIPRGWLCGDKPDYACTPQAWVQEKTHLRTNRSTFSTQAALFMVELLTGAWGVPQDLTAPMTTFLSLLRGRKQMGFPPAFMAVGAGPPDPERAGPDAPAGPRMKINNDVL